MTNDTYDFTGLLGNAPAFPITQLSSSPPQKTKNYLHFESSRANGTFSLYHHHHWTDTRNAQFHAWKQQPATSPETARMAGEIVTALSSLFGGTIPLCRFTSPPRGITPADQPHAAQELARGVALICNQSYQICVERLTPDTQTSRSRMQNLRDDSTFSLLQSVQDNLFTIVIDDVSTTGSTLKRMRSALTGIPTLLLVYVVWH